MLPKCPVFKIGYQQFVTFIKVKQISEHRKITRNVQCDENKYGFIALMDRSSARGAYLSGSSPHVLDFSCSLNYGEQ